MGFRIFMSLFPLRENYWATSACVRWVHVPVSGPSVGGAFVGTFALGFAGLCHLVLSVVQWNFKSDAIPRSWWSQIATVSTQHLPCAQSKVYPREPPVRHHCVLPAEDVRWDEGYPTIHPLQVPALQGSSSFQLKKKKKQQRKGQGNKGKGFFLLGAVGAVHEQGLFQSISFALEVDLRWSEIIFQIKAMFQKKNSQKPDTQTVSKTV